MHLRKVAYNENCDILGYSVSIPESLSLRTQGLLEYSKLLVI